jgi:hypothetical protein
VLATEDDPEGQKHCVEDTLPDVPKQQHPGPVKANGKPFHWDIDKSHGNPKGKDDSDGERMPEKPGYSSGRESSKNTKPALRTEMLLIETGPFSSFLAFITSFCPEMPNVLAEVTAE